MKIEKYQTELIIVMKKGLKNGHKISVSKIYNGLKAEIIKEIKAKNSALKKQQIDDLIEDVPFELPKESAIDKWIRENKIWEYLTANPLDRPWNIGLSMKYKNEIPADIVPVLVKLKQEYAIEDIRERDRIAKELNKTSPAALAFIESKLKDNEKLLQDDLTIRTARWIAYLYPSLKDKTTLFHISIIAEQYAEQEAINEIITGEISPVIQAPDTSSLDDTYFIQRQESPVICKSEGEK